ncbi:MAG: hypothetical protein HY651_10010 [Acidobacteria bacterium]|nr:hypothetical protein [Acidobacteriota bacterium]
MESTIHVFVVIATALLFGILAHYVWLNRTSEKIVTSAVTAALVALAGVVLSIFVFGAIPTIEKEFAASFICNINSKIPYFDPALFISHRSLDSRAVDELAKANPEALNDVTDVYGIRLYHQLLQREMLAWLALLYREGWEIELETFEYPDPLETWRALPTHSDTPKVLTSDELSTQLGLNKFAAVHIVGMAPEQITLPQGTRFTTIVPSREEDVGEIGLENDFFTISIETKYLGGGTGIGSYRHFVKIPESINNELRTNTFRVRIRSSFARTKSGHPRMGKYRAWADQLTAIIQNKFDEVRIVTLMQRGISGP